MADVDEKLQRTRWEIELEKIRADIDQSIAQTCLARRQGDTEFWKIGVAAVVAGAVLGGFIVQIFNMMVGR